MTVDPDFAPPDPPPQGEASVALSDKTLLTVSLAGFIVLATTVYILIIRSSLSAEALEGREGGGINYDDELDTADVRTLNRAQRRARARNRMKKNRRIDPRAPGQLHHEGLDVEDDDGGGAAVAAQHQLMDVDEAPPAAPDENDSQQHLSRKERARMAKATEREERKLFEKERQEQRRKAEAAAAVERREREKEREAMAQEEKRRRETEAHDRKLAEHREWMLMFADSQNASTVKDFICKAKLKKIWSVDDISQDYGVTPEEVEVRVRQLVADDRIFGIVSNGHFVHLEPDDMEAIAAFIKRNGRTSLPELSREILRVATGAK